MATTPASQVPPAMSESAPQILATEHWALLSGRSMLWNESFSRTSVFLNVLSATVVALALVADATAFGDTFGMFAIVLFPLVLFLGLATFARLIQINVGDAFHLSAMNRLRHGYLDLAPELAPYFTSAWHDDLLGMNRSFALGAPVPSRWLQVFIHTPMVVATVNAIIAAAGTALIASRYRLDINALIGVGLSAFVLTWTALFLIQVRVWTRVQRTAETRFPTPPPA